MDNTNISFDQLPKMVSDLSQEIKDLKELLSAAIPSGDVKNSKQGVPTYRHELCDINRAMEITGKARSTIYALVRMGIMPSMKQGKKLYFFEDEIARWIEQGRKAGTGNSPEEMLLQMRSSVRHKPKSILKY